MTCGHLSIVLVLVIASSMTSCASGQGCRVADAALRYDHVSYLFVGPDYIKLSADGVEESVENKEEEWGGLERLDAALTWKDPDSWSSSFYPVFLEGATYSYYSYWRGATYGPFPVEGEDSPWDAQLNLGKGIDATVTVGGRSVFFKCCNFICYDHDEEAVTNAQGSLKDLGLPCNVHAATHISDDQIAIIKYDQMWLVDIDTVDSGEFNVTGPIDANEALGLKTIKLCGEHEDAGISLDDLGSDSSDDSDDDDTTPALDA